LVYRSADNTVGYIDHSGKLVIPFAFCKGSQFSEGLAVAAPKDNLRKFGYIDKSGNWVIKPRFKTALPFREGLAQVGSCQWFVFP
jgi:hypothetical protein